MEAVILPPSWESRQTWGGLQESSLEKRPDPKAMQLLWMEEAKADPFDTGLWNCFSDAIPSMIPEV